MCGHEVQTANWSRTDANYGTERNVSAGSVSKQVHWWILSLTLPYLWGGQVVTPAQR